MTREVNVDRVSVRRALYDPVFEATGADRTKIRFRSGTGELDKP